ncbi:MAG: hypothetical protein NE330_06500, partial [Lentisphaeraceae bacterium]|nr:hypothetical protein [Lentisphaeraceae bacterium]
MKYTLFIKFIILNFILLAQVTAEEFNEDFFYNPSSFRLKPQQIKLKFPSENFRFIQGVGFIPKFSKKSTIFTNSNFSSITVGHKGFEHLEITYESTEHDRQKWQELYSEALTTVQQKFRCTLKVVTRDDGCIIAKAKTRQGLCIQLEFFCPNSINYQHRSNLLVKFSNSFTQLREQKNHLNEEDKFLRAFANYVEVKYYNPLTREEIDQIAVQTRKVKTENYLAGTSTFSFYTKPDSVNPHNLTLSDKNLPITQNYLGKDKPSIAKYLKWTVVDNSVRRIEFISDLKNKRTTKTIYKAWFIQQNIIMSEFYPANVDKYSFAIYEYKKGRLNRTLVFSVESDNIKNTQLGFFPGGIPYYIYNEHGRLLKSKVQFSGINYLYDESPQYKESSFRVFSPSERIIGYSIDNSDAYKSLSLPSIFLKRNVDNYWSSVTITDMPHDISILRRIPSLVDKSPSLLSYRHDNDNKPLIHPSIAPPRVPVAPTINDVAPPEA